MELPDVQGSHLHLPEINSRTVSACWSVAGSVQCISINVGRLENGKVL